MNQLNTKYMLLIVSIFFVCYNFNILFINSQNLQTPQTINNMQIMSFLYLYRKVSLNFYNQNFKHYKLTILLKKLIFCICKETARIMTLFINNFQLKKFNIGTF